MLPQNVMRAGLRIAVQYSWMPLRFRRFQSQKVTLTAPPAPSTPPPGANARKSQLRKTSEISPEILERLVAIPTSRFRNFSIVAHIDHGKSTLSDRLLELTGVIAPGAKQILDKLDVERERGITVKAQTCAMIYRHTDGLDYLLNLVDTPGHVDFRQEVSRSYAACGGCLLLVDASQGVQAQTVANHALASSLDLELVPVLNKIDLPHADIPRVTEDIFDHLSLLDPIAISAKTGLHVEELLPAIVERIPAPKGSTDKPLRCLLIDSWHDQYLGVVMLVHIVDGSVRKGQLVLSAHTKQKYTVREVGIMHPEQVIVPELRAGQLGYIVTGMKDTRDAKSGDTFMLASEPVEPLPGFEDPKPMVFMGAFPAEGVNFQQMEEALELLTLNDRSVTVQRENSHALGQGWRLGFLGTLHASVFQERLQKEHGRGLIFTAPTVPYKVVHRDGTEAIITNPNDFPQITSGPFGVSDLQEPFVDAAIVVPPEYAGQVVQLCVAYRGQQTDSKIHPDGNQELHFLIPLAELVDNFFGKLKGATKGYASLDYEDAGYQSSNITKLELLVNGQGLDALSKIIHKSQADEKGREWVRKFRPFLRYQLFEVIIQARCGNRILARETIKAKRKDVTAKLHASDISRHKKLLQKQKEGKKQMQLTGKVRIPQEAYQGFLSSDQ